MKKNENFTSGRKRLQHLVLLLFCIGCGLPAIWSSARAEGYNTFPYTSNFGTVSAPGEDNSLYQFANDLCDNTVGWAMEALNNNLYPTFTENGSAAFATLITRPFEFKAGYKYRLTVVYESDAFPDAAIFWRLAAPKSDDACATGYDVYMNFPNGDANEIKSEVGLSAGVSAPHTYDFTVTATGVYALTFAVYGKDDAYGYFTGSDRKLRIQSIKIEEKTPYDLAMGRIITPVSHHNAGAQTVSAWVRNEGSVSISSFSLYYTIGSQVAIRQTFNTTIPPGGERLVKFDTPAELSPGSNRIRVFLTGQRVGDPVENDTSATVYVVMYDEPYQVPFSFNFDNNTLNQRWTIDYDQHTDQTTWQYGRKNDKDCAYVSTAGKDNNARLISPGIHLLAGKTYRFRFRYTGLTDAKEKLAALMVDDDFMTAGNMTGYWKDEGFDNGLDQMATFFYTAPSEGEYHMAIKVLSDPISGGVAVWDVNVDAFEPNRGDFYFEFDPMVADVTAGSLWGSAMYFMDKNHNGQAWQSVGAPVFNGEFAAGAGEAFGSKPNDWLVFNPMYLEAGKTYTVRYMTRAGGNNRNLTLESMVCRESFAYGNAADIIKMQSTSVNSTGYEEVRYTFTPSVSEHYVLAFRYEADIVQSATVTVEQYRVYLDHVGLFETERNDFELAYVEVPVGAKMGQRNVYIKCGYRNHGAAVNAGDVKFYYSVGAQPTVMELSNKRVESGGIGRHGFNAAADFSRDTLNEVRVWAEYGDRVTDTFKTTIHSLKSYYPPYRDLMTEETKAEWHIASLTASPSWQFVTENIYDAPYAARTASSDGILNDYLVMPAVQLLRDTVYRVTFYAKGSQERKGDVQSGLSVVYSTKGYGAADFDHTIGRVDNIYTDYQPYTFYFKAQENGPAFLALHSTLPIYSGENWVDHVVVMDSITASYSYMTLANLSYRRVTGCDEDRTSEVELLIKNDGYLAYDSVPVMYKMDENEVQTYWVKVADMSSLRCKLPHRWDLSVAGNHKMKVWLGMPNERNRADDTLMVSFRADDMAQLPLGYDFENNVLPGNTDDLNQDEIGWELHRNIDSAYRGRYYVQYRGTGQKADDDWRLPCFFAPAGEYTLDFFMNVPYASEELITVSLLHYDEYDAQGRMVEEVLMDTMINHAEYKQYQLPFKVKSGHYGIKFHIKSEADGNTLCIDNLTIADYGLKDVALLEFISPTEIDILDNPLNVTVRLRNNGRVTIFDIPMVLYINDEEVQREEVPMIKGNDELVYTFPNPIDLHEPGTYRVRVEAEWVLDQRLSNNHLEITRIREAQTDLALMVLAKPMAGQKPYSERELLSVRIENRGRGTSVATPIVAIINETEVLNGIVPPINKGEAIVYTFEQTMDMSDSSWYEFLVCLSPLTPDDNPLNDTLYSRIDGCHEKKYANETFDEWNLADLIYPNPARTVLNVEVPQGFTQMAIYSLHGVCRMRQSVPSSGGRFEIPVYDYPSGLYILKLIGPRIEKTVKWIKTQ